MQEGCPAEPEPISPLFPKGRGLALRLTTFIGLGREAYIIQHLEGMKEIVLMGTSVANLHPFEGCQFREDDRQKTSSREFDETYAGLGRKHDFIQFVDDALLRDYLYAFGIAHEGLLRLVLNLEMELGGKAHTAHHAQGVVGEGDVWVERCGYETILHIQKSVEPVDELTEMCLVETYGKRIDGEIATVKVVLQGSVLHDGLAAVVGIAFATGTDKLYFQPPPTPSQGGGMSHTSFFRRNPKGG